MLRLTFEETNFDVSKLEVGKEYKLEMDSKEYGYISVSRALVTKIDIESNTIEFKSLREV